VTSLVNQNVKLLNRRTSIRLEPGLWALLDEVCRRERCSRGEIIRCAELQSTSGGRTSALRVYLLRYFREAATELGHKAAGHGSLRG
jgi:predicted DNA-binding ribbon-helix-helix protein